ncbi:O-antigen ligase family protein [Clostridium intestinale]|uniref:O-antigen ligase family protein n=1 Tax=Clostridium intestinale TaxID=36845 RepID=A0A7D6W3Y7_9CLOT|nr:O-antigen ligase family protein [Clostridium intestinale]QLY82225.1 O-antigen ligase family protein [Clostridium intestinale]
MKSKSFIIYFFSKSLFFCVLSLFMIDNDVDSSKFTTYNIILVLILAWIIFFNFIKQAFSNEKKIIKLSKVNIIMLIIILLTCLFYSYFTLNKSPIVFQIFKYFIGFTIPSVALALIISNKDIENLYKDIKFINIFITMAFCIEMLRSYNTLLGFNSISGASHLLIGYTMSALFPYNFIKLTHEKKLLSKLLYLVLLIINVFIIFASGSKGSLVSIAVTFVIALFMYGVKKRKFTKYIVGFSSLAAVIVGVFVTKNLEFKIIFWRIASLFSSNFTTASSGRDIFYFKAISDFKESPVLGNGIGYYAETMGSYVYPHNIILEILETFGVVGIIAFSIIMIILLRNTFWLLKQKSLSYHVLAFLFVNVMVELMFSSSFLVHHQFWLLTTLILTLNKEKYKDKQKEVIPVTS